MTIAVEGVLLAVPASVWLALVIELAVQTTVLMAVGWLISLSLRRRSAASRSRVWTAVFAVVVLALPAKLYLQITPGRGSAPGWLSTIGEHQFKIHLDEISQATGSPGIVRDSTPAAGRHRLSGTGETGHRTGPDWVRLTIWCWLVGASVLLLGLGRGVVAGLLAVRRSCRLGPGELLDVVAQCAGIVAVSRQVEVRLGRTDDVPYVVGVLRPVVVLPRSAAGWSREALRTAVVHEMAHVVRADYLTLILLRAACALMWFHPAVWWSARRAALEMEVACDDLVLRSGARAVDYARQLLLLAIKNRRSPARRTAALAMAERSNLEERVIMILDPKTRRPAMTRNTMLALVGLIIILSLPLAAVQVVERDNDRDLARGSLPTEKTLEAVPDVPEVSAPPEQAPEHLPAAAPRPEAAPRPASLPAAPAPPSAPEEPAAHAPAAPAALEDDETLSELLEDLLSHLQRAKKSDGKIVEPAVPADLLKAIVDHVLGEAPQGRARAEIRVAADTRTFGIVIQSDGQGCPEPEDISLKVRYGDGDGDGPDYLLAVGCGD